MPFGAPTHPTCTHLGAHAEHHARTLWRKLWPEESGRNGRNLNQFVYLGCIHEDSLSWLKRVIQAPSSEPHRHGPLFVAFSTGVRIDAQILKMFGKSPMFLHSTAKRLVAVSTKPPGHNSIFLGKSESPNCFFVVDALTHESRLQSQDPCLWRSSEIGTQEKSAWKL